MKKMVEIEKRFCDFCSDDETAFYSCGLCGMDVCWECRKNKGDTYEDGVYATGRSQFYCDQCLEVLEETPTPLYLAYVKIRELRKDLFLFNTEFRKLEAQAEENLKVELLNNEETTNSNN